ncbi:hypothetical protein RJ639_018331 [Escallonia herrerae]|uniref:Maternal effect embryo arrest protein n=1 Tax=Escallonia herrerae TaxID=1293975 RepID=A0AA88VA73_9ASTE|nr:hypothetical protein RJ639_018331 [Escallonia herrerae]
MSPFFGRSDYQELTGRSTAPTKQLSSTSSSKWAEKTSVRITAVDAIANVNALFTVAIFIGLSVGTPDTSSSNSCVASATDMRRLFVYEVVSFSFFLFSSLTAQGLKLALNLLNSNLLTDASKASIHLYVLKAGIVASAFGSVMACFFLLMSMTLVVQVKLGTLSCGGDTLYSILSLIVLVGFGLVAYVVTLFYGLAVAQAS